MEIAISLDIVGAIAPTLDKQERRSVGLQVILHDGHGRIGYSSVYEFRRKTIGIRMLQSWSLNLGMYNCWIAEDGNTAYLRAIGSQRDRKDHEDKESPDRCRTPPARN